MLMCLSKRIKGSHRACLGSRMKIVAQSHTTEGLSRLGLFCLSLLLYFPKGLVAICGILPGVSELKARLPVGVVLGCCGKRKELGSKFSRAKNAVNTRASKWNDLETLVGLVPVLPDLYTQSFEALMYYTSSTVPVSMWKRFGSYILHSKMRFVVTVVQLSM